MIREVIIEAMKIRKIKSKDLAEVIGVAKSSMALVFNGKMNLGKEKIEMVWKFLNIELVIR